MSIKGTRFHSAIVGFCLISMTCLVPGSAWTQTLPPSSPKVMDAHKRQLLEFRHRDREKRWEFEDELIEEQRAYDDEERQARRNLESEIEDEVVTHETAKTSSALSHAKRNAFKKEWAEKNGLNPEEAAPTSFSYFKPCMKGYMKKRQKIIRRITANSVCRCNRQRLKLSNDCNCLRTPKVWSLPTLTKTARRQK